MSSEDRHQTTEQPHISDTGSTFCITSGRSLYYIFKIIMKNHVFFIYFNLKEHHFITNYIYGQSPRLQESYDPSSVLVCSDLHFCLTSFIIEFMQRPFRKCIVFHSLDKKNCAFDHWNEMNRALGHLCAHIG